MGKVRIAGIVLSSLLAVAATAGYAGTKIVPMGNILIMGGQSGESASSADTFGGNIDILIAPAINFSPRAALIPMYRGSYSSTKDVREIVGGGTLTRETQDHALTLRFVTKLSDMWKVKTRAGYKIEYLKETNDEAWGNGSFDHRKLTFGAEGEYTRGNNNVRFGADLYTMQYPNYSSLITKSQFQQSLDTATYSELSAQAGKDVLDNTAFAWFVEAGRKLSPLTAGYTRCEMSLQDYRDQRVVLASGKFSEDKRKDMNLALTFGIDTAARRAAFALSDTVQYNTSNQNSFDIANSKYIDHFYDYVSNTVSPSLTFNLGPAEKLSKLSLYWEITYRRYAQRVAQYEDSTYKGSEKLYQTFNTVGLSYAYPVTPSLTARLSANYRDASSNTRYERAYKYNYYIFNYYCGLGWEW